MNRWLGFGLLVLGGLTWYGCVSWDKDDPGASTAKKTEPAVAVQRGTALDGLPPGGLPEVPPGTMPGAPPPGLVESLGPWAFEAAPPPGAEGLPAEVKPLSFRDLSLLGSDVNGLLDLIFEPEGDDAQFEFPKSVADLNGRQVAIVGYMIPLDWLDDDDGVTQFMLVRDFAQCCFGGMPRPDEWIDVTTPAGEPADFFSYRPVRVVGTLTVGLDRPDQAMVASVYQMVTTNVTDRW